MTNAEEWMEGQSGLIIGVTAAFIVAGVIAIYRPQVLSFFWPGRVAHESRAKVVHTVSNPAVNPSIVPNPVIRAAGEAERTRWEAEEAKYRAEEARWKAVEASHEGTGNPERALGPREQVAIRMLGGTEGFFRKNPSMFFVLILLLVAVLSVAEGKGTVAMGAVLIAAVILVAAGVVPVAGLKEFVSIFSP